MQPFNLKAKIVQEEFDYQTLSGLLASYSAPRDKITSLIKQGVIIRVKKGLYIFGKEWRTHPYSIERLANLIMLLIQQTHKYLAVVEKEIQAFGFNVTIKQKPKLSHSPLQSAFLKTETAGALLIITSDKLISRNVPA